MLRRVIVAIVVLAALTVGLFCLLRPATTVTDDPNRSAAVAVASLYCQNDGLFDNHIFTTDNALSTRQEIEAILYDDQLHDVTYTYTGQYADHPAAVKAETAIHAAVNTKITQLGVTDVGLNPSYSIPDAELIVRITATEATLSPATAPLVLLSDQVTSDSTLPQGVTAVEAVYTNQGFTCQSQKH